jgi:CheY-like chemotaxis protein
MTQSKSPVDELARILIVDDEVATRMTLQAILAEFYQVQSVSDANQAERILESQSIDVLLTDYEMPGRSGIDLITAVLERFPHVVSILLTGYSNKQEVRRADKDRNVFAVLTKPYEPLALLRALQLAVATARLRALQHRPMSQKGED